MNILLQLVVTNEYKIYELTTVWHYIICSIIFVSLYLHFILCPSVCYDIYFCFSSKRYIISSKNVQCSFKNIHFLLSRVWRSSLVFKSQTSMENIFYKIIVFFSIFIFIPAWIPPRCWAGNKLQKFPSASPFDNRQQSPNRSFFFQFS